jgi:hypothetical protein
MAAVRPHIGPSASRLPRRIALPAAILLALATGTLLFFVALPGLLAPVEDFAQGPSGIVGYVSLSNQLRAQSEAFWTGGDVELRLTEEEFSGMLSSALLTGRQPGDPIQRVRGTLAQGEIWIDTVLQMRSPSIPTRLQGPIGLRLQLVPEVAPSGDVLFRINRTTLGRLPIPPALIRLLGEAEVIDFPGFDARTASISLPLGDLVATSLGRRLEIKQVLAERGLLSLTIALPEDAW